MSRDCVSHHASAFGSILGPLLELVWMQLVAVYKHQPPPTKFLIQCMSFIHEILGKSEYRCDTDAKKSDPGYVQACGDISLLLASLPCPLLSSSPVFSSTSFRLFPIVILSLFAFLSSPLLTGAQIYRLVLFRRPCNKTWNRPIDKLSHSHTR